MFSNIQKTVSLLFQKNREKKNEPNKKENLKNVLDDGLHKPLINGGLRPPILKTNG